jgi:RNA polymerase sigma-70 factor, ECF subfamily
MSDSRKQRFQHVALPHLDAAYSLARWLTGNSHDAEDITQEAFMRAFRFFDSFRGEDPRSWLLKIVRNTYYSHWRRSRGRDEPTEFDEALHSLGEIAYLPATSRADSDPESIHSRAQDMKLLHTALEGLPADYREALVLREIEDLSYKQIAAALDVPIGTVMSRIARARRLLLEAFNRLGGERQARRA